MKEYLAAIAALLLLGAPGIRAANNNSADTAITQLSQQFSTVDQAARAIWSARVGRGTCTPFVLGPIPGKTNFYLVYFLTPDYRSFFGIATIVVEGTHFCVPPMGCCFFYQSGKAEGTFNLSLYDAGKVKKYVADRYSTIGLVKNVRLIQPGISIFTWLWEITTQSQTYYLYVVDDQGYGQLLSQAELDHARAADVVKVDSVITDRRK
ncbi:MAG: hypothetical protein WCV50_05875 [Patescibacteria group bacterium]